MDRAHRTFVAFAVFAFFFARFEPTATVRGSEDSPSPASDKKSMREMKFENYRIQLDLSKQVIGVDIPEDRSFGDSRGSREAPIQPTLTGLTSGIVSASVLAQKAKQFDDGLYAAVDLAAQSGSGRFAGKQQLLESLCRVLAERNLTRDSAPLEVIYGAARLGGVPATAPQSLKAPVERRVQGFLGDELRAKPIGFYTWSKPLESIFQQDRMLQSELEGKAGIEAIAQALFADEKLRGTYEAYLLLVSRLTNPLAKPDLRGELAQLDKGSIDAPSRGRFFFPPSIAHETELVKRLYGDRPIPPGFNLADEMVKQIRAGGIQLMPRAESGWYDYQTWSLEPMVIPEKMREAKSLQLSESYRKQLVELFKGILALTRETHIKQLEIPAPGAAIAREEKKIVRIAPELSAEPIATWYLRRAIAYRFVRGVLEGTFGSDALASLFRQTAEGPVKKSLAVELPEMESLFFGAHCTVCQQLGMDPDTSQPVGSGRGTQVDIEQFSKWVGGIDEDSDVSRDARMMVPVFYDVQRRKTKVWVFLGWSSQPVRLTFAKAPTVEVQDQDGKKLEKHPLDLQFVVNYQSLAYPVTAEVYVTRILNRSEFRQHCDQYKTRDAILKNLK
jgi:hypothetical protein